MYMPFPPFFMGGTAPIRDIRKTFLVQNHQGSWRCKTKKRVPPPFWSFSFCLLCMCWKPSRLFRRGPCWHGQQGMAPEHAAQAAGGAGHALQWSPAAADAAHHCTRPRTCRHGPLLWRWCWWSQPCTGSPEYILRLIITPWLIYYWLAHIFPHGHCDMIIGKQNVLPISVVHNFSMIQTKNRLPWKLFRSDFPLSCMIWWFPDTDLESVAAFLGRPLAALEWLHRNSRRASQGRITRLEERMTISHFKICPQ